MNSPVSTSRVLPALMLAGLATACDGMRGTPPTVGVAMDEFSAPAIQIMGRVLELDSLPTPVEWVPIGLADDPDVTTVERVLQWSLEVLRDQDLVAVVGPAGSRAALAVAPVFRDARIPMLIPNSTSDELDEAGPWIFRLVPGNQVQGDFLADFALENLQARSATIFFVNDEYGVELAQSVAARFTRRGGVVLDRVPMSSETQGPGNDYDLLVEQALLRGRPDVVFMAARVREVAPLINRIAPRSPGTLFLAGDGALDDGAVLRDAPAAASGYYRVAFWHSSLTDSASTAFARRFEERQGAVPGDVDALTFDALALMVGALGEGARRPAEVAAFLESLGVDRPAFPGVTGPLSFQEGTRRSLLMIDVGGDSIVERVVPVR